MSKSPKYLNNVSLVSHSWLKKPSLIVKGLKFMTKRIFGKDVIRGMDIAITYDCNLKCSHCNVAALHDRNRKELDVNEVVSAIQQLRGMGGFYVTFTGGEVLLQIDKLEEIISAVGKTAMLYQVQTNGLMLNGDVCRRLKNIGVDNIQISFDTYHEKDNWTDVLKIKEDQAAMLKKLGFRVYFTWLASHESLSAPQVEDLIQFSNKHRVTIGLNFAVPQGRWSCNEDVLLTPEDSIKVRRMANENKYLFTDLHNNLFHYGCPAFSERLHINGYGDVQPCTFFQISFGNIREEPLRDIWLRGLKNPLFASFPDHCPPAENKDFVKRWIEKSKHADKMPIPHLEFFQ